MRPFERFALVGGCIVALVLPSSLRAQGFGAHIGYDSESEEALAGVQFHIPISIGAVPKTTISPQAEALLIDGWIVNAGASIRFHPWWSEVAKISPYFGAGMLLGYNGFFDETNVAGLAIAGLEFPLSTLAPYAHIEFAFGDFDITAFIAGIQLNF